jgi:thiol-disulfide isomerase/thioredoxin
MDYKIYIVLILSLVLGYLLYTNYFKKNYQVPQNEEVSQLEQAEYFSADSKKPVLKLYYTNWCGWSKKFLPVWNQLHKKLKIQLEKIDCEKNPEQCQGVPGFPYIVLQRGNDRINYKGNRTLKDIEVFVKNNTY